MNFEILSLMQKKASLEEVFVSLVTDDSPEKSSKVSPPPLPGFNHSGGA